MTTSPTIKSDLQRRASTELLSQSGVPLADAFLMALVTICALGSPTGYYLWMVPLASHNMYISAFLFPSASVVLPLLSSRVP